MNEREKPPGFSSPLSDARLDAQHAQERGPSRPPRALPGRRPEHQGPTRFQQERTRAVHPPANRHPLLLPHPPTPRRALLPHALRPALASHPLRHVLRLPAAAPAHLPLELALLLLLLLLHNDLRPPPRRDAPRRHARAAQTAASGDEVESGGASRVRAHGSACASPSHGGPPPAGKTVVQEGVERPERPDAAWGGEPRGERGTIGGYGPRDSVAVVETLDSWCFGQAASVQAVILPPFNNGNGGRCTLDWRWSRRVDLRIRLRGHDTIWMDTMMSCFYDL
ncbi:hypothetical protein DFH08DRAFT_284146 [Mycena albidolilacea]|uniref:Uncharacterized protein n=1 Tax=Mycena albidolilacea TaxID=1033008 RepID=A0AAD6ZRL3_9AGAR|nr:hypothetical protein DFH08DRAFT_284146 [Mycena albidolilacea]